MKVVGTKVVSLPCIVLKYRMSPHTTTNSIVIVLMYIYICMY